MIVKSSCRTPKSIEIVSEVLSDFRVQERKVACILCTCLIGRKCVQSLVRGASARLYGCWSDTFNSLYVYCIIPAFVFNTEKKVNFL